MPTRDSRTLVAWRPFFDVALCYGLIGLSIFLGVNSPWFYPLSVLIIANRILALSLICHEGLHGNLFRNMRLNIFWGRWLCAFPTFISFSKYRKLHLLHHRTLGTVEKDPDLHLYRDFPLTGGAYFVDLFQRVFTFRIASLFIEYYTEYPELWRSRRDVFGFLKTNWRNGDLIFFTLFHAVLLSAALVFGYGTEYLLYYLIPVLFVTQPYVMLMGGLQHGPLPTSGQVEMKSRSIRGPKWLMEILLPLDINFHAEHHLDPAVPHYNLKRFSKELEEQGQTLWRTSYASALRQLFSSSK
ncbi:MAG: fatty acid desaturase family protein [Bdellovibrionales bacterium]